MKCDAVFEGGGVKGIAFVGAVQELERRGYNFNRLAGTSAGAITASILAAGYTGRELETFMTELNMLSFLELNKLGRVPLCGKVLNLICYNGIYCANQLEKWVADKLEVKGVHTFADVEAGSLKITASDITNGRLVIFPDDLEKYGLNPESWSIAKAVRMSCTIPYFFQPYRIKKGREKADVVDGGLLSNYPIWIFDTKKKPRWPTFGFRLRASDKCSANKIRGPITYLLAILNTMMDAHDKRHIEQNDWTRTISIPVEGIRNTDFSLSCEQKEALIKLGREEASLFFDTWSFFNYINSHGQNKS